MSGCTPFTVKDTWPRAPQEARCRRPGSQPAKSQTSNGNRRYPMRACNLSKRKQGILSNEELERESSILKKQINSGGTRFKLSFPFYRTYKVQISHFNNLTILTQSRTSSAHSARAADSEGVEEFRLQRPILWSRFRVFKISEGTAVQPYTLKELGTSKRQ